MCVSIGCCLLACRYYFRVQLLYLPPLPHSVGNGSWVREGVTTVNSTTDCGQSVTTVQCASTHLTSFAVLVDVAGGLRVRARITLTT